MTASSKVRNIALSQLVLSPTNVRKTPATAAEDAALEASIRAEGILQNLIVHALPIDGKGVYEVDAGGRRLKILQKLAAEGVIDADHPVPCLVKEPAGAVETSLMENTIRAAMHPAIRSTPSRRASAPPNGTSSSVCAWASWRPNCSTLSVPAIWVSMS
jgi:ParB family transcriptional regulator, chromosome partitioning protein